MKILLVNHLLDAVSGGGTAERTYQIARQLAAAGAECIVLTLDIGITAARRAGLGGAKLVAVPCLNERFFVPRLSGDEVRRLVASVDVVQLSGHWTLLNAVVFRACRKLGKPFLFCPAGALKPFGRSIGLKWLYQGLVGRRLTRSAAACVAITESERADLEANGVPAERIVVIPNGIDSEAYRLQDPEQHIKAFRAAVGLGGARFVLFLGRLNPIKGPDLLLQAYARAADSCADAHLVLAGPDGGMQAELEALAQSRGLADRVHFIGFVGGDRKIAALRAASVLAIPSRREAMSIVVLEGGICGCPVLFTDACGLDELAYQGAGQMVPVSAEALAGGLVRLLADPDGAAAAAERLQRIVTERFHWRTQADRYLSLAERVRDVTVPA